MPRCSPAQYPKYSVQHSASFLPWPTAPARPPLRAEQLFQSRPWGVGEVPTYGFAPPNAKINKSNACAGLL